MKVNDKTTRDRILEIYKKNPQMADDDKLLIATIWWLEGWKDPGLYQHLKSVSSPETIRRTRAKLVEEGLIESSESVNKARKSEEQNVRASL